MATTGRVLTRLLQAMDWVVPPLPSLDVLEEASTPKQLMLGLILLERSRRTSLRMTQEILLSLLVCSLLILPSK